jgi:hypothetical protein
MLNCTDNEGREVCDGGSISLQADRRVKSRKRTVYKRWLLLLGCEGLAYTVVVEYWAVLGEHR